ncbi:MAG: D-aminoacyl-tRNA deacylase [Elusimicrobiota bacterium]
MKAVVTRVLSASVLLRYGSSAGEKRSTGAGLLILLGVGQGDDEAAVKKLTDKILAMRIFPNDKGKFDKSVVDVKGEIMLISQFTLLASLKGGRRPDLTAAARPDKAEPLYRRAAEMFAATGLTVRTGEFGATMEVESVNNGPVTIILDTAEF